MAGAKLVSNAGFDSAMIGGSGDINGTEAASVTTTAWVTATAAADASGTASGQGSVGALGPTPIQGPSMAMIATTVGGVVAGLLALSIMLGYLVSRNSRRRRQREQQQQKAHAPDIGFKYDEAGINVSTTIDQREFYKAPSVTTQASSDGRPGADQGENGLAQGRVVSAVRDYISSIGRAKWNENYVNPGIYISQGV
ncbi:Uu.00g053960.m01.CDS01 [Anthostomella pinea]|uniref:Uu.00g053960.m01.CDS01 n=1 Tax=Anthostomella pinea TaxID=933095 RepID=A0AAI8YPP9_9PEZI|nr:Uu.00g053960.m01.CDS01 [Anthostomella pinea]